MAYYTQGCTNTANYKRYFRNYDTDLNAVCVGEKLELFVTQWNELEDKRVNRERAILATVM